MFEVIGEKVFKCEAGDQYDNGGSGVFRWARNEDFFDGLH